MRIIAFGCFVLIFASSCGGCGEPCDDVVCPTGTSCDNDRGCIAEPEVCEPACAAGEICQNDQCFPTGDQCTAVGDLCAFGEPLNEGFFCVDLDGDGSQPTTCVEFCGADGSCADGSTCFLVNSSTDALCESDAECASGKTCQTGACRDQVCRPSECEGFLAGAETCNTLYAGAADFPNGGQCIALDNGANFCFPAGEKAVAETCTDIVTAFDLGDFSQTCSSGLACVDSQCREACAENSDCDAGDCLLAEDDFVAPGVGFCGESCTPFGDAECEAGSCLPLDESEGLCVPSGNTTAFESCVPGSNSCEPGTFCIVLEQATGLARCLPLCNAAAGPAVDGAVTDLAQLQRDATCPQPPQSDAFIQFTSMAEIGSAVDVYFNDEMTPRVTGLDFEATSDDDPGSAPLDFLLAPAGQYTIRALPAGAPRSDPPLVEFNIALVADVGSRVVFAPVADTPDEIAALVFDAPKMIAAPTAGQASLRTTHVVTDYGLVDVVLVPPADDLTDPNNQTVLATGLDTAMRTDFVDVAPAMYELLAFPTGDPRTDRTTVVFSGALEAVADQTFEVFLRGTIALNDIPLLGVFIGPTSVPPATTFDGPRYSCIDVGSPVFGFCQQTCGNDPAAFKSGVCEGDSMGCVPTFQPANGNWQNLCGPTGDIAISERCNTRRTYGECGEGAHCLEYGNAQAGFDVVERGLCQPLCDANNPAALNLQCGDMQACQPIVYNDPFSVGRCGFDCDPTRTYSDAACPVGLDSCRPTASLVNSLIGADPMSQVEQSFCSASGVIGVGEGCAGADCVAGSECMFPRSVQNEFTASLLSPYFGSAGLQPTCMPQCDPFEGDSSDVSCANGETCLFNFPWSAEVGHCAEIKETLQPLAACTLPGEACGEDSICLAQGGGNLCFQFCQYEGPVDGVLPQGSCGTGFQCTSFVNDIGVCLQP